jgi:hypothetical protein
VEQEEVPQPGRLEILPLLNADSNDPVGTLAGFEPVAKIGQLSCDHSPVPKRLSNWSIIKATSVDKTAYQN